MFTSIYSKWWVQILTLRHFTVQLIKQGSHNSALYKASQRRWRVMELQAANSGEPEARRSPQHRLT